MDLRAQMPEFFNVLPPGQALRVLLDRLEPRMEAETVPAYEALGRVTAAEVLSAADLPAFPRSTMDGYSVRSADTFGATESLPAFLDVVGEVAMGARAFRNPGCRSGRQGTTREECSPSMRMPSLWSSTPRRSTTGVSRC